MCVLCSPWMRDSGKKYKKLFHAIKTIYVHIRASEREITLQIYKLGMAFFHLVDMYCGFSLLLLPPLALSCGRGKRWSVLGSFLKKETNSRYGSRKIHGFPRVELFARWAAMRLELAECFCPENSLTSHLCSDSHKFPPLSASYD